MSVLGRTERNQLKISILKAREISEEAAKRAVDVFAVSEANAPEYLTSEQKDYRLKLRAHGRELGDKRSENGKQSITHLVEEIAYEEWHKMLFARFLAENNILMYPDGGVNVSLTDCEDLAKDEGYENKWECAAAYASKMLPMIFKTDSLISKIKFNTADRQKLEEIIEKLDTEVFFASDALGWCYQFWQEKRKDSINNSEVKIGEDELSPVTQLFTEPYMVSFLLDNALGAWYANIVLTSEDLRNAKSEEELREKASLSEIPLEYLRFIYDEENSTWKIASNTLEDWPKQLSELKVLDPCCGSGHFLVAVFRMLVAVRQKLEGTDVDTTIQNVLKENINGLELDGRCVELAVFALAFSAWTYPNSKGYCELPKLNIACCGKSIHISKTEWEKTVNEFTKDPTERITMGLLYKEFKDAPTKGSLIAPEEIVSQMGMFTDWNSIKEVFTKIVQSTNDEEKETGLSALGIIESAELLSKKYSWIVTNPPYLGQKKLDDEFREWLNKRYKDSCSNLATVFMERFIELLEDNGRYDVVVPNQWCQLTGYKDFRKKLLKNNSIDFVIDLGAGAFEEISGEVVKVVLVQVEKKKRELNTFIGLDLCSSSIQDKKKKCITDDLTFLSQKQQFEYVDSRIILKNMVIAKYLSEYADNSSGGLTGDGFRFHRNIWEQPKTQDWEYLQTTVKSTDYYGGCENVIFWEQERGQLKRLVDELHGTNNVIQNYKRGQEYWGKNGVTVSCMGKLPVALYMKEHFDCNTAIIVPKNEKDLLAIYTYCEMQDFERDVHTIDNSIKVTTGSFTKVQFDKEKWEKIAAEKYPNGLPKPFTDDPTQWIFHGHPCKSVIWNEETKTTSLGDLRVDSNVLQVAIARMLGYEWPAESDKNMELAPEQRIIVDSVTEAFKDFVDDDGIVCIPALNREKAASERLISVLAKAYGSEWNQNILNELLKISGFEGKTLDSYLRDGFFKEHCKTFNNRPFIWQIWDGLNDGFSVLVNYHKLDNKLLSKLIYTVLGDWILKQKTDYQAGVNGAERKLEAAQSLQKKLIAILEGESPVDIFVRWKKLEEQSIGWNPDLNDGVRMNIRPFVLAGDVKAKGAGVLRDKFNINWNKDRGKDVETSPWYKEFKGERINDYHLTLQQKKDARK